MSFVPSPRLPSQGLSRRDALRFGAILPAALAAACTTPPTPRGPLPEDGTIDALTLLGDRPGTGLFIAAMKRAGMDTQIDGRNGIFTLFVPTDAAIEALPPAQKAILTGTDVPRLQAALKAMIARNSLTLDGIAARSGPINTLAGTQLRVTGRAAAQATVQRVAANGTTMGPAVTFARADVRASNAVIHIVNGVLTA